MFTVNDFKFTRLDTSNGHEDYWFDVSKEAEQDFFWNYHTQGVEGFPEIVYSKDEDVVGIKRQYLWNWDVILSNDSSLKNILRKLANSIGDLNNS